MSSLTVSGSRFKHLFTWERFQTSREWTENNIYLNSDVSPITGYINMRYTPHLVEMFKDYDVPTNWKFTFMASSQCGKTTGIFALAFKQLDTDPSMSNIFIPADDGVRDYVVQKLDPFLKGIKSIQRKLEEHKVEEKTKDIKATKTVAGGMLGVSGSSARQRRSKTLKSVFLDEVSLFPKGAVTEIVSRTKSFEKYFRKVFLSSTIRDSEDEIVKSYNDSELKKEWKIECPDCKKLFYPKSEHFKFMTVEEYKTKHSLDKEDEFSHSDYKDEALSDVYVECPNCEAHIDSRKKDELVLNGGCRFEIVEGDESKKTIGYKANALAMYSTNYETIAQLLIDAKDSFEEKALIYIEYFNEILEQENSEKVSKNDILLLSNNLDKWVIPKDTVKLYFIADTQKDHWWWTIQAYTYGFKAHTVANGRAETKQALKELMYGTYQDETGRSYRIDRCGIDRRGIVERTLEVDEFIMEVLSETGELDFIYATEGVAEITGNMMYRHKRIKKELDGEEYEFKVISISNLLAKNELNNMIQRNISKVKAVEGSLAQDYERRLFFINQTIVDDANDKERSVATDYERQMTSEEYIYKIEKGKRATKQTWEKRTTSVRNDYWDCATVSVAFAEMDLVANIQKPVENHDDGSKLLSLLG